ncbi:MAG: hypothetical protein M3P16_05910 [Chloroflexota bacterium]|nr:hypothetical protein [Chloroflexota bacterium]
MRSIPIAAAASALLLATCMTTPAQPPPAQGAVASRTPDAPGSDVAPSAPPTAAPLPVPFIAGPIQLLNADVGWATINSRLARTLDGGKTWFPTFLTPDAGFVDLRFVDAARGWAILWRYGKGASCASPQTHAPCWSVVTTSDGGTHWEDRLSVAANGTGTATISSLQAIDDQHAWVIVTTTDCDAAGCAYELRTTADGGATWQTQLRGRPGLGPVRFASARRGWIASGRAGDVRAVDVLVTNDGGMTWRESFSASEGVITIDAASEGEAWILTRDGGFCTSSSCSKYELLRTVDGGATWSSLGNPKEAATCSGGHLEGPLFASPRVGWFGIGLGAGGVAVGRGGTMRTTDGGKTWDCKPFPANTSALSAADPLHVWVRSDDRQGGSLLYWTSDGGASWHRVDSETLHPTIIPRATPGGLALPARCRYVSFTDGSANQSWDVDCGASNDARGLLAPALTAAGWRGCGVGLGTARWRKDALDVGISETASPDDPIRLIQSAANGPCG